jgi:hypothetical protein
MSVAQIALDNPAWRVYVINETNSSRRATHAMKSIDIVVTTCGLYDIRVILSVYPLHSFIIPALYFLHIRSSFPQYLFKSFMLMYLMLLSNPRDTFRTHVSIILNAAEIILLVPLESSRIVAA